MNDFRCMHEGIKAAKLLPEDLFYILDAACIAPSRSYNTGISAFHYIHRVRHATLTMIYNTGFQFLSMFCMQFAVGRLVGIGYMYICWSTASFVGFRINRKCGMSMQYICLDLTQILRLIFISLRGDLSSALLS